MNKFNSITLNGILINCDGEFKSDSNGILIEFNNIESYWNFEREVDRQLIKKIEFHNNGKPVAAYMKTFNKVNIDINDYTVTLSD